MTSPRLAWAKATWVTAVLVLLLPMNLPAGATATSIRLVGDSGPPATHVGVIGAGFGSSELVDVAFDRTRVGTAAAGPGGRFSIWVEVPADAGIGVHTVQARGRTSHLVASAPFTVRIDWPMFHATTDRRGHNPYETTLGVGNVSELVPSWIAPTSDFANEATAVVDGVVYTTADPDVYAFDAQTGEEVWSLDLSDSYQGGSAPAVAYGRVFVAFSGTGTLMALDAATGALLWEFPTGGAIYSDPAVVDGTVYVGSNDRYTCAVNAFTGELMWRTKAGNRTPAVVDGVVYTANDYLRVTVSALDARTGQTLWSSGTLQVGGVTNGPVVAADTIYVTISHFLTGGLFALDAATGQEVWTTPGAFESTPAVANGIVYVGGWDGSVYALDPMTGEELWAAPTGDGVIAAAAVANGLLSVPSKDTNLMPSMLSPELNFGTGRRATSCLIPP